MRRDRAIAAALPIAALALVEGLALSGLTDGGGLRSGAAFVLRSPDRWLAPLGLGLVLATLPPRSAGVAWTALVGGAALGIAARHSPLWPWIQHPSVFPRLHLLGPAACLLAGLSLVTGGIWRRRAAPVLDFAAMAALLLAAGINDPMPESTAFLAGASMAAFGLVLAAAGLRRRIAVPWTSIGERIAGSWLLTIGLLLSALQLVPGPAPILEAAPPASREASRPPAIPDFEPAAPPIGDVFSRRIRDPGLPRGVN